MVFSAHTNWTYANEDFGLPDYCAKPPFDCAFVLLRLNWVRSYFAFYVHSFQTFDFQVALPIMLACLCCTMCCAACCMANNA